MARFSLPTRLAILCVIVAVSGFDCRGQSVGPGWGRLDPPVPYSLVASFCVAQGVPANRDPNASEIGTVAARLKLNVFSEVRTILTACKAVAAADASFRTPAASGNSRSGLTAYHRARLAALEPQIRAMKDGVSREAWDALVQHVSDEFGDMRPDLAVRSPNEVRPVRPGAPGGPAR